jgi:hypothetical protein
MWCGSCYTSTTEDGFFVQEREKVNSDNIVEEDQDRLQAAWGRRHQPVTDFYIGRDGDHLMVPFECDICIFQKLKDRSPIESFEPDKRLLRAIRRANLDAFWSRATSTVKGNRDRVKNSLDMLASVGLRGPYESEGSFPPFDHCGYEIAILMLIASQRPGKYSNSHSQWDTIRKYRTAYSNHVRTTPQSNTQVLAFGDDRGQSQRTSQDKCFSVWFSRFFIGCKRRMGQDWRPNKALGTELIRVLLDKVEQRRHGSGDRDQWTWMIFGAYVAITYTLSLRGVEGLLLDLGGLVKHSSKGGDTYVIIALSGKVKGEHRDRCHLLPCVKVTSSGINIGAWVQLVIDGHAQHQRVEGPAISDMSGLVSSTKVLDENLVELLEEIYDETPSLFPASIHTKDEIQSSYQVYRSLRRSSDTRALEKNVSQSDINLVNRWHTVETAQGNRPNLPMSQHYAQVELLLKPFLRYTGAM